ncbi:glycogen/starch synthase [bacterium]|nr:glycogen/starch synthase [bacterium]
MNSEKRMRKIEKRVNKILDTFEKKFVSQTPSLSQIELWQETRSQVRSGLSEIIDAAQPPYVLYNRSLPLILVATPEIVHLPANMGSLANYITTGDGGGLSDISAALITELNEQGVNVHVTLPEYKSLFQDLKQITERDYNLLRTTITATGRIHMITDDIFKFARRVYDDKSVGIDDINLKRAIAFMRGVISRLLPRLKNRYKHVLVHCNDWMTGLIPPAARSLRMQSLMTFHNVFTMHDQVSKLREKSIDISPFWRHLIIDDKKAKSFGTFDQLMNKDPWVDFMTSGLYAADHINTVSKTFLKEIVEGYFKEYNLMSEYMRSIVIERYEKGRASGIRNAPTSQADPRVDPLIAYNYWYEPDQAKDVLCLGEGKARNKELLQKQMGLRIDPDAPVFFWPSRIARPQKGFELLLAIIPALMSDCTWERIQIAIVANGDTELVSRAKQLQEQFPDRVRYSSFERKLSQMGLAGGDFVLMPSLYEPCGTPQVVGQIYGTPPVVRKTGGLADTVHHLSHNGLIGSGFVFEEYNSDGLLYGISEAMRFWRHDKPFKCRVLERIIRESTQKFNIRDTARKYIELYEDIFERTGIKVKVTG